MTQSHFEYHVFVCLNQRENGDACCMQHNAEGAFDYLKKQVKQLGLSGAGKVRINRAGCLDRCAEGPVMVVYPDAVWYTFVDHSDIDEIIHSHLQQGQVVARLQV